MLLMFDLDGTLLNTIADLGTACNHALQALGFPIHPIEEYPHLEGNGVNKLIERALPAAAKTSEKQMHDLILQMRAEFIPFYNAHNLDLTPLRRYYGDPASIESSGASVGGGIQQVSSSHGKGSGAFLPRYVRCGIR